jgi:hypothetical protein
MKKFILWLLAFLITIAAAYYQRKTGPTYPKSVNVNINGSSYILKLVRSMDLKEKHEVKLNISDTTIEAKLHYRRFPTNDEFTASEFRYKVYPVRSFLMNRIFGITEERGFFAEVPPQPPAGKLEYYIEINSMSGEKYILEESPVVLRFKGDVPVYILIPHIILMFLAMFFSTLSGLLGIGKYPSFRRYSRWTLILLVAGGIILGPLVQKFAFGEFWTGIPLGWDLTDNKTLIAFIFWLIAVLVNRKKERPFYVIMAAIVLLLVFSIPHSLIGSELDYESGKVIQGFNMVFLIKILKNS